MTSSPDAAAFAHCRDLVRTGARAHFLATLMAPAPARGGLFAITAFDLEIARIRAATREAMAAEIRLQWWRDALAAPAGEVTGNPVADALRATIAAKRLPLDAFLAAVDAHTFDVYDDPMPSLVDLEGYAGETAGALIQLAAIVLADGEDPGAGTLAGHAGVATTILSVLTELPLHAARRQMFLPADVLARYGADPEDVFAGRLTPAVAAALAELRGHARRHLDRVRIGIMPLPTAVLPPLTVFWRIWRAARSRRRGF